MTARSVDLPHLRSVVLAGHAGAGKTTLGEQLLFKSGAVGRVGKVEDGTSHLDFELNRADWRPGSGGGATCATNTTGITGFQCPVRTEGGQVVGHRQDGVRYPLR